MLIYTAPQNDEYLLLEEALNLAQCFAYSARKAFTVPSTRPPGRPKKRLQKAPICHLSVTLKHVMNSSISFPIYTPLYNWR